MHQKTKKGLVYLILSLLLTLIISTNSLAITDSIPTMTSNTAPSGTAESDSILNGVYQPYYAFDDNPTTRYINQQYAPFYLSYAYPTQKIIDSYSIKISMAGYSPTDWRFEGYNGTNWIVLDTRTGQTPFNDNEERIYSITNNTAYQKYRIYITSTFGNQRVYISEIQMQEKIIDSIPPQVPEGVTSSIVYTDRIILDWVDNLEPDFQKYRVVRDNSTLGFVTGSTFEESNLLADTLYTYQISAIDIYGNESSPATISVNTALPQTEPDYTRESFQVGILVAGLLSYLFIDTFKGGKYV